MWSLRVGLESEKVGFAPLEKKVVLKTRRFGKMRMTVKVLLVGGIVGALSLCGEGLPDNDPVLDTIAQINHMNWVVTKINHYSGPCPMQIDGSVGKQRQERSGRVDEGDGAR